MISHVISHVMSCDVRMFCFSFQNSQKEMSIVTLPEVLCIHLKRFRFDAYISTKISRNIRFPLTGLSMEPFLKQKGGQGSTHTYDLNAVITHYGGAGGKMLSPSLYVPSPPPLPSVDRPQFIFS